MNKTTILIITYLDLFVNDKCIINCLYDKNILCNSNSLHKDSIIMQKYILIMLTYYISINKQIFLFSFDKSKNSKYSKISETMHNKTHGIDLTAHPTCLFAKENICKTNSSSSTKHNHTTTSSKSVISKITPFTSMCISTITFASIDD